MILEQIVIDILNKEIPKLDNIIKWDGMYNKMAEKIVKEIKEEIVR